MKYKLIFASIIVVFILLSLGINSFLETSKEERLNRFIEVSKKIDNKIRDGKDFSFNDFSKLPTSIEIENKYYELEYDNHAFTIKNIKKSEYCNKNIIISEKDTKEINTVIRFKTICKNDDISITFENTAYFKNPVEE